jgi:hypothetical protein
LIELLVVIAIIAILAARAHQDRHTQPGACCNGSKYSSVRNAAKIFWLMVAGPLGNLQPRAEKDFQASHARLWVRN